MSKLGPTTHVHFSPTGNAIISFTGETEPRQHGQAAGVHCVGDVATVHSVLDGRQANRSEQRHRQQSVPVQLARDGWSAEIGSCPPAGHGVPEEYHVCHTSFAETDLCDCHAVLDIIAEELRCGKCSGDILIVHSNWIYSFSPNQDNEYVDVVFHAAAVAGER